LYLVCLVVCGILVFAVACGILLGGLGVLGFCVLLSFYGCVGVLFLFLRYFNSVAVLFEVKCLFGFIWLYVSVVLCLLFRLLVLCCLVCLVIW